MKKEGALALAKKLAPQETRTFFVSSTTWGRRSLFQTDRMCELFVDVLRDNRAKGRLEIHEFLLMPNHFHLLITPAPQISLEKCLQYVKGGFSFQAKKDLAFNGEIWQAGYNEERIGDLAHYRSVAQYIRMNPVERHLVESADAHRFSSANPEWKWDDPPLQFRG